MRSNLKTLLIVLMHIVLTIATNGIWFVGFIIWTLVKNKK